MHHLRATLGLLAALSLVHHADAGAHPMHFLDPSSRHVEAAPPPQATPVIASLGTHYDATGRYHSTLSPYSLMCPWAGQVFPDIGLSYDEFTAPSTNARAVDVFTSRNSTAMSQATLDEMLIGQHQRAGYDPQVVARVRVLGHLRSLWRYGHPGQQFASVAFPAGGRLWLLQLTTDDQHLSVDVTMFVRILLTLRLENAMPL